MNILSKLGGQTNFCKFDAKSVIYLLFFLPPVDLAIENSVTVAQDGSVHQGICASGCQTCAELYMRDSSTGEPDLIHHEYHGN